MKHDWLPKTLVAVVTAYVAFLFFGFSNGAWIVRAAGGYMQTDFVNVYAAGTLVLDGAASSAYDWPAHKAVEVAVVGHDFNGYFGWHYPPPLLMIAALLALLPYVASFLVWQISTMAAYIWTMRTVTNKPIAILAALAWPSALVNVMVGQNGFLTAALLGAGLYFVERRAVLAGVLIGLMTYKPQFGLLIPVALLAGGYWRTIAGAAATTIVMALASLAVMGIGPWQAFPESLSKTSDVVMGAGAAGFYKMQSVFAYARASGLSENVSWGLHFTLVAVLALGIAWLWRSKADYSLKAAGLIIATTMASPYVYSYDMMTGAVALGFLGRSGFSRRETIIIAISGILVVPLVTPNAYAPTGLITMLLVLSIVVARVTAGHRKQIGGAFAATA